MAPQLDVILDEATQRRGSLACPGDAASQDAARARDHSQCATSEVAAVGTERAPLLQDKLQKNKAEHRPGSSAFCTRQQLVRPAVKVLRLFALVHWVLSMYYTESGLPLWDTFARTGHAQLGFALMSYGFSLATRYAQQIERGIFQLRRFTLVLLLRVYPVYFFMILLNVVQLVTLDDNATSLRDVLVSLAMLQPWVRTNAASVINPTAWVVSALLFCSIALFPAWTDISVKASQKTRILALLPGLYFASWVAARNATNDGFLDFSYYVNYVPFRAHAPIFLMGVTLGVAYVRRNMKHDSFWSRSSVVYGSGALCALCVGLVHLWHNAGAERWTLMRMKHDSALLVWLGTSAPAPLFALLLWVMAVPDPSSVEQLQPHQEQGTSNVRLFAVRNRLSILDAPIFQRLASLLYPAWMSYSLVWNIAFHVSCRLMFLDNLLNGVCWVTDLHEIVSPVLYFPFLLLVSILVKLLIEAPALSLLSVLSGSSSHDNAETSPGSIFADEDDVDIHDAIGSDERYFGTSRSFAWWNNSSWSVGWWKAAVYYVVMPAFLFVCFRTSFQGSLVSLASQPDLHGATGRTESAYRQLQHALITLRWISVFGLIPLALNVLGHLLFPPVIHPKIEPPSTGTYGQQHGRLYFRYVTRGSNPDLLSANVIRAHEILDGYLPKDSFTVEVVTDQFMDLSSRTCMDVSEVVVPDEYVTLSGAKYKARALQYAIEYSTAADEDWIIHLDEETKFDWRTVDAICAHVSRECSRDIPRVGQGTVIYGDGPICNLVTTLADSYRVADDYGKFRIQYELHEILVGMHGSFVVCMNKIEKLVSFDHGLAGSITEDTYFAFVARQQGVQFEWIDAFMYEQSPFTFKDFLKQRARWLGGLIRVCLDPKIELKHRVVLWFFNIIWISLPVGLVLFFLCTYLVPVQRDSLFALSMSLVRVFATWSYLLGFFMTFSPTRHGISHYIVFLYLQITLQPVFGLLEAGAVIYTFANIQSVLVGFHVVQKQMDSSPPPAPAPHDTHLTDHGIATAHVDYKTF